MAQKEADFARELKSVQRWVLDLDRLLATLLKWFEIGCLENIGKSQYNYKQKYHTIWEMAFTKMPAI